MTFVRVRLALDQMQPGQVLCVTLSGDEPRENVPRSSIELGHEILALEPGPDGLSQVWIRKR